MNYGKIKEGPAHQGVNGIPLNSVFITVTNILF